MSCTAATGLEEGATALPVPPVPPDVPPAPAPSEVPPQALELVTGFEGFRSSPYQDSAGVWTIGYGSTRDASGNPVTATTPPVTTDAAEALLARDMDSAAHCIDSAVTVEITGNQYAALCSFVYNVGQGAFQASTLLKLLNEGNFSAASAQFPRWNLAGGRVLQGLVTRRATERRLFDTP